MSAGNVLLRGVLRINSLHEYHKNIPEWPQWGNWVFLSLLERAGYALGHEASAHLFSEFIDPSLQHRTGEKVVYEKQWYPDASWALPQHDYEVLIHRSCASAPLSKKGRWELVFSKILAILLFWQPLPLPKLFFIHNTSKHKMWEFPPTTSCSSLSMPTGCPTIQLNYDTVVSTDPIG